MSFFLPIVFLGFFIFMIFFVLPNMGDWRILEKRYRTEKDSKSGNSKYLRVKNCNIGGVAYSNVVKFYEVDNGLFLKLIWVFKGKAKNIHIPWDEIKHAQKIKSFIGSKYRLIIGDPFVTFIELSEKDFLKIKSKIKGRVEVIS